MLAEDALFVAFSWHQNGEVISNAPSQLCQDSYNEGQSWLLGYTFLSRQRNVGELKIEGFRKLMIYIVVYQKLKSVAYSETHA